jgi:hypothetical protein
MPALAAAVSKLPSTFTKANNLITCLSVTALTHQVCYFRVGGCLSHYVTGVDKTLETKMKSPITLGTRRELTAAVRRRYQSADRNGKKLILDEFTKVAGYHRKHAIRILTHMPTSEPKSRVARRVYQDAAREALIVLWEAADRICSKRLKALLPQLLEAMERHGHLQVNDALRTQLLAMSASTIDRQLEFVRERACGGRKRQSSKTNRVRKLVAVRTFADWEEQLGPGYLEIDLVTHSGPTAEGSFVHTLVLTDIVSTWTECVALPVREQSLIVEAINGVRPKLPFPLRGLDTDNDSAFMNDTLWNYCQTEGIVFTRSRAYHKNDQAWVEQKNGSIVRKLVGYGRLQGLTATAALRRLYEASRLYINFFQPSFKLKSKERHGARVHKSYHAPQTPYARLMKREDISCETKEKLKRQMESLDPVMLLKHIRDAQDTVMALSQGRTPEVVAPDVTGFVKSLKTAWHCGVVRPTHRQEPKPGRRWRTRPDPFAEVWPVLLGWLEEKPDMEAKQMLKQLQATRYADFPDKLLRTLQRRVRTWRMRIVQQLVYGTEPVGASAQEPEQPQLEKG